MEDVKSGRHSRGRKRKREKGESKTEEAVARRLGLLYDHRGGHEILGTDTGQTVKAGDLAKTQVTGT